MFAGWECIPVDVKGEAAGALMCRDDEIHACIIEKYHKRIRHKEVVLNFQTGVGLEDGTDPLIYLTYSDDGGHSYITPREPIVTGKGDLS